MSQINGILTLKEEENKRKIKDRNRNEYSSIVWFFLTIHILFEFVKKYDRIIEKLYCQMA